MFFAPDAPLRHEFDYLYVSIFDSPRNYIAVIEAFGKKRVGMTREEIVQHTKLTNSGTLTRVLRELETCGFIRTYTEYGKKEEGRGLPAHRQFHAYSLQVHRRRFRRREPVDAPSRHAEKDHMVRARL